MNFIHTFALNTNGNNMQNRTDINESVFSPEMKLGEMIDVNYRLLSILSRLDVRLGFGEMSVEEMCRRRNMSPELFLMICRVYTFDDYVPSCADFGREELRHIIDYLKMSHRYYSEYVIPRLCNEIDNTVQVGPNPEEMAVLGNHLYVVNSDGMNWPPANCSVSKINLDGFTEVKKIEVGNNPNKIVAHAASGKLFVACWGDFYNNPNSLWTIDAASDEATDLQVSVTFMCISGDVLYTIYDSYNGPESVQYVAYNAEDNSVLDDTFIPVVTSNNGSEYNRVDSPAGITVNPADGHIFIASYVDDPVNAYTLPSYVYEYNAQGEVQRRYDVGVGAANMLVLE